MCQKSVQLVRVNVLLTFPCNKKKCMRCMRHYGFRRQKTLKYSIIMISNKILSMIITLQILNDVSNIRNDVITFKKCFPKNFVSILNKLNICLCWKIYIVTKETKMKFLAKLFFYHELLTEVFHFPFLFWGKSSFSKFSLCELYAMKTKQNKKKSQKK